MKTAGFPCRMLGCDEVFQVADQKSMVALNAASAARNAHEVGAHDYRHVMLSNEPWPRPYRAKTPRPVVVADPSRRPS